MLYATGTANSGVSIFIQDDRLVLDYNCFGDHHVVESDRPVPVGDAVVGVRFVREDKEGSAALVIDGDEAGTLHVPFAMRMMSSIGPSVGFDHGSPVSERYGDSFPFEGRLLRIDIQLVVPDAALAAEQAATDARVTSARQ